MTRRTTAATGRGITRGAFFIIIGLAAYGILLTGISDAAIQDRVIAFVDDHAITLSELEESYKAANALSRIVTHEEVLNTMINRVILLKEAKKYRIEAPTIDEVLKEYIDLKIRAFIRVNDADIEKFYNANLLNFQGKGYEDVRDEIDMFLTEKLLNERLKESLNDLRKKSYIRIYLDKE
ncbi:MAG: SurA N-terminal domain-containing protein [Nitrospirae bacterium]|nr:SurA N-terminal domain-containing protein [Nitrospirota bacterium]